MSRYPLNHALTQIDDRYLTMVDRSIEEVQTMRQKTLRTRKIFRTVLIAAVAAALMGITAYAFSSIHAARQRQLRAELQIEENAVSGYTEYPEASAAPSAAAREAEPRIQLISSLRQGEFQTVYFSVSPVPEEIARRFFFGNMEIEFVYIASNEEIPDEYWHTAGSTADAVDKSFAHPVPYTEGHEAEHMIESSSQTGLPDENGNQQTVTFEVVDPAWYKPLLMQHSYDAETQSLMLMCGIYREQVDLTKPVYFSVRCLDGPSVWADPDIPTEEYIAGYAPVYLEDYGTVTLEAADTAFVSLPLPEPIHLVNPENNGNLDILAVRLSANCAEWKITHDDVERIHNLNAEDPDFHESFEKQLQWIRFQDEILSGAFLRFEDGSTLQLNASAAAPYQNGVVTLTSVWDATIDIGSVRSITVMGTEYPFPESLSQG
ncbi:MAG: hypothetical protein IJV40_13615 [Oscillospiraceae bacterium]|nr:hypothetical protein [Oscillospiraceae bacterium]